MINRRIGSMINIAVTDDKITLVESAEIDGFRRRNIVSTLFDRMTKLIPAAEAKKLHAKNEIELLKRVSGGTMKVWFLVDDLDATYQRSERENIELSTFFSACRSLATQVNGLNFRITMRTDVWPLIRRFDEQLDKMDQYVSDITWSQNDFRRLLAKRIRSQLTLLEVSQADNSTTDLSSEQSDTYKVDATSQPEKSAIIGLMSTLEEIEAAVQQLPPAQRAEFRAWFQSFDATDWDHQIEDDITSGNLDWLADEAISDRQKGRCSDL